MLIEFWQNSLLGQKNTAADKIVIEPNAKEKICMRHILHFLWEGKWEMVVGLIHTPPKFSRRMATMTFLFLEMPKNFHSLEMQFCSSSIKRITLSVPLFLFPSTLTTCRLFFQEKKRRVNEAATLVCFASNDV